MNTNQITSATTAYQTSDVYKKNASKASKNTVSEAAEATTAAAEEESAVVWEKNSTDKAAHNNSKNKNYVTLNKENQNLIAQLKADAEERTAQLRSLVENMLLKQNQSYQTGTLTDEKMYEMLRKGEVTVTPEVRAQAEKDIAEDGYWGVEQTSERLFSFAKAISGGDTSKLDKLMDALEKGFKQATKAWGDELPEISKKTLEATKEKLNNWAKESQTAASDASDTIASTLTAQAGNAALATDSEQ